MTQPDGRRHSPNGSDSSSGASYKTAPYFGAQDAQYMQDNPQVMQQYGYVPYQPPAQVTHQGVQTDSYPTSTVGTQTVFTKEALEDLVKKANEESRGRSSGWKIPGQEGHYRLKLVEERDTFDVKLQQHSKHRWRDISGAAAASLLGSAPLSLQGVGFLMKSLNREKMGDTLVGWGVGTGGLKNLFVRATAVINGDQTFRQAAPYFAAEATSLIAQGIYGAANNPATGVSPRVGGVAALTAGVAELGLGAATRSPGRQQQPQELPRYQTERGPNTYPLQSVSPPTEFSQQAWSTSPGYDPQRYQSSSQGYSAPPASSSDVKGKKKAPAH